MPSNEILQDKRPRAQDAPTTRPSSFAKFNNVIQVQALVVLAALASPISQLTLAPTFGGTTSSINHLNMITFSFISGLVGRAIGFNPAADFRLIPLWASWIPVLQYLVLPFNAQLGPIMGPILNGFLSCNTLLMPTAYAIASIFLAHTNKLSFQTLIPLVAATVEFRTFERVVAGLVKQLLVRVPFLNPVHLQLSLAGLYTLVFPSWLVVFAVPAVLFTNPHLSSSSVDASLRPHNWTLLERQWSNTGYISVLESFDTQYRVMRCDHSLLGGEWLLTEDRKKKEGWKTTEPIYAVFQMLEAVRLMQVEPAIPDSEAQALVIGLGIGTAPKAFVSHGIQTTVVELDPVVHDFATKYFDLPANHTSVIQDAVSWADDAVSSAIDEHVTKYDYIIHDVFTGGTEPLPLFTAPFLRNLRSLLGPNGIIAINYAGDPSVALSQKVFNTVFTTFSHQCKIYRDAPPEKHSGSDFESDSDFTNMVLFCRNAPGPIAFRAPRPSDLLGSKSRRYYMRPKPEHEVAFVSSSSDDTGPGILDLGDVGAFEAEQGRSAIRHWKIMRKVLPDAVWDVW